MTTQHAPRNTRNVAAIVATVLGTIVVGVVALGIAFVVALSQAQF